MEGGLAQLEWSRDVLATRLPVAALYYPPEPGLQAARGRAFDGLPGFLADGLQAEGVPTAQSGMRWWPSAVRGALLHDPR